MGRTVHLEDFTFERLYWEDGIERTVCTGKITRKITGKITGKTVLGRPYWKECTGKTLLGRMYWNDSIVKTLSEDSILGRTVKTADSVS